jgi:hypothetical protein
MNFHITSKPSNSYDTPCRGTGCLRVVYIGKYPLPPRVGGGISADIIKVKYMRKKSKNEAKKSARRVRFGVLREGGKNFCGGSGVVFGPIYRVG